MQGVIIQMSTGMPLVWGESFVA